MNKGIHNFAVNNSSTGTTGSNYSEISIKVNDPVKVLEDNLKNGENVHGGEKNEDLDEIDRQVVFGSFF